MRRRNILIAAAAALACIVGIAGIVTAVRGKGGAVDVTKVSYLNNGFWDGTTTSGGYVTANASQEVYLNSDSVVEKVYVKEGDKVKIGDTLLEYDKTLLELDLEEEKLNGEILELELKGAENDLEKLKKITPVADSAGGSHSSASRLPDDESEDDWNNADDSEEDDLGSAGVIPNQMVMVTAASDSGVQVVEGNTGSEGTEVPAGSGTLVPEAPAEPSGGQTPSTETEPSGEQTPSTETKPSTEGSAEETEEVIDSPLARTKAYKKLDYKSKYYKGSGTKEDPYLYLCTDGAEITASFMNMILGFNTDGTSRKKGGVNQDGKSCYAVLQIREGDSLAGGFLKSVTINGTVEVSKAYAPDVTWTFTSQGITKNVPDIPEEPSGDDGSDDWYDDGMFDFGDDVYTESELKEAISEKEKEIKELKLDIRDAEISIKQAQRKMDAATIKATINGVVKEVGDPKVGQVDGEAFMTITSNSGMYVKGTVSEMDLGTIEVGAVVSGMAQESGISITAEITEISEYPTSSGDFYYYGGDSNPNASNYPFIAYIEDSEGLINNEYVDLQITGSEDGGSSIYLVKSLIRTENGQSYVYIEGEDKKLKKQYVRTGQTLYSSYIEVKEGLTEEDWIAFPYGKNVKEGAPVNELEGSGFADQMYF